jgi:hypothetical protein
MRDADREQLRVIEAVLRRWDPTGRGPLEEYDSYAPGILGKLQAGVSLDDLTRHLHGLTTQMAVAGNIDRDRIFATELLSWWVDRSGVA